MNFTQLPSASRVFGCLYILRRYGLTWRFPSVWSAGWLLRMATNDKGAEPFVAIHNAMLKVLQVGTCS